MVEPQSVERIVIDAARLVGRGEIVVFGSSALAFWMKNAPASRDVDVWCQPPDAGHAVQALMGELSWYHERHGVFVEVWARETFAAPCRWRDRARSLQLHDFPEVHVIVPHPHDVLMAKLERMEGKDREHIRAILAEYPLTIAELARLEAEMPHRTGAVSDRGRVARFEVGLEELRCLIGSR